jgi:hypothetical protein
MRRDRASTVSALLRVRNSAFSVRYYVRPLLKAYNKRMLTTDTELLKLREYVRKTAEQLDDNH